MCPSEPARAEYQTSRVGLFDSEEASDVTFVVGGQDRWRFPGHRAVLRDASPVFRALLHHHPGPEPVLVTDCDGRAFDLLLRYLYKEDVKIQSVTTALGALYAGQKYLCSGLVSVCLSYLHDHINEENVLEVYHSLRIHCGQVPFPTAPPEEHVAAEGGDECGALLAQCRALLSDCCRLIDSLADRVLAQEVLEDLPADALRDLLERDTLAVTSESNVYNALERWANRECKRCQLELSAENRRAVVGDDLLFSCRYLTMNRAEFCAGPVGGGLLSPQEIAVLLGIIMSVPNGNTASTLTDQVMQRISRRRVSPPSSSKAEDKRKEKKKKKKKKSPSLSPASPRCSNSCALDYVARGLSCLFD